MRNLKIMKNRILKSVRQNDKSMKPSMSSIALAKEEGFASFFPRAVFSASSPSGPSGPSTAAALSDSSDAEPNN